MPKKAYIDFSSITVSYVAYYNCTNFCMCLKQRTVSIIVTPFQDTYWLSKGAAYLRSSWHGCALPPLILILLEPAKTPSC